MDEDYPSVGDYYILDRLGFGSQGTVKKGCHKKTKKLVAIKVIKKSRFSSQPTLEATIEREVALMRVLDHPHLLKLLDVINTKAKLYLVLELMERGELYDHVLESGALYLPGALRIFRQIVYGLEFLHSYGICHRDMKLENLLVDENYNVKISDFGLARWTKDGECTPAGTLNYMAPEVTLSKRYDGRAADVWSTGVILFAMLVGQFPFSDNSRDETIARIRRGAFAIPASVPADVQDLIRRMLTVDPLKRMGVSQIREHPAFRGFVPADFVLPRPIPAPHVVEPIDPKSIDPELIRTLNNIGLSDEKELREQLAAEGCTYAKTFLFLMLHRTSFECLPWGGEDDPVVVSLGVQSGKLLGFGGDDTFGSGIEVFRTEVIRDVSTMYENLIVILQKHLTECGYDWFFPNDVLLMARCDIDGTDLVIKIEFAGYDKMNVEVGLASGDDMGFTRFVDSLSRRIA
jgi:BR serine/threonine kinase